MVWAVSSMGSLHSATLYLVSMCNKIALKGNKCVVEQHLPVFDSRHHLRTQVLCQHLVETCARTWAPSCAPRWTSLGDNENAALWLCYLGGVGWRWSFSSRSCAATDYAIDYAEKLCRWGKTSYAVRIFAKNWYNGCHIFSVCFLSQLVAFSASQLCRGLFLDLVPQPLYECKLAVCRGLRRSLCSMHHDRHQHV